MGKLVVNACVNEGQLACKLLQVFNTAQFLVALLPCQVLLLKGAQKLGKLVVNACSIEVSLAIKLFQVFNTVRFLVALLRKQI